jgi:hypothetical protein
MANVYVVTAYRFGDRERHSYVVGVFTNAELAIEVAEQVPDERAGKYYAEVLKFKIDKLDNDEFEAVWPLSRYDEIKKLYGEGV